MVHTTYTITTEGKQEVVTFDGTGGGATVKMMWPGKATGFQVPTFDAFSAGTNQRGGMSYALIWVCLTKAVQKGFETSRVPNVHGALHATLHNIGFVDSGWRYDPTAKTIPLDKENIVKWAPDGRENAADYDCANNGAALAECNKKLMSKGLTVAEGDAGGTTKCRCWLTTASCEAMGLPDDCEELTLLRRFRDEVMMSTEDGRREVAEYRARAPEITRAVAARPDADRIWRDVFHGSIRPAAEAIARADHTRAHEIYTALVRRLEALTATLPASW